MAKRTNWPPELISRVTTRALELAAGHGLFHAMRTAQEEHVEADRRVAESTLRNPSNWSWPLYETAVNIGLIGKDHPRWQRKFPATVAEVQPTVVGVLLEQATVSQLLEALGKRMQNELEQRLLMHVNDILTAGLSQVVGEGAPPTAPKTNEMPPTGRSCFRALAVGLLPVQQQILEAKLASYPVELRCWKDGPHDTLRALARWADRTFLATKFVGHETQNVVRGSTDKITYVNGAVTDMVTLIGLEANNV